MYFWKVNGLIEDFRAGRVSQRQRMYYYLTYVLCMVAGIELVGSLATEFTALLALELGLSLVINTLGILRCFDANARGDNAEFIDRMICLGWPISLRLLAAFAPIYLIYGVCLSMSTSESDFSIINVFIDSAFNIYLYRWLHSSLLKITGQQTVSAPVSA